VSRHTCRTAKCVPIERGPGHPNGKDDRGPAASGILAHSRLSAQDRRQTLRFSRVHAEPKNDRESGAVDPPAKRISATSLGARFEPLVDKYYVARAIWAPALTRSHSEHDRRFGPAEDRGYQDTPEIRAAWDEITERTGVDDAADRLSAIWEEMEPIADAISAAPVNSIEGLRAKALVAFWKVAPLCAGETTFYFDDAHAFQQLFTAVAELCGLTGKMATTGYTLSDLDAVDEDDDEEA
jgi:hypothetical protein